jgi:predicted dehydrogenase
MYNALLIGCGNIGALYDFDNDQILTHAKAYHLSDYFSLTINDLDKGLQKKVSDKYQCEVVDAVDEKKMAEFDCVSICTPTPSHFSLLSQALHAGVKVVICEKPVSNNAKELETLKSLYDTAASRILVNYIRRFQPAFQELKGLIINLLKHDSLTNICIRYQRGFMNNCSHALDIIEYLTDSKVILNKIQVNNSLFDHFENDPTLSLQADWNNVNMSITGLTNVYFTLFEIDFYFHYHRICLKNSGQEIEVYKAEGNQALPPLELQNNLSRHHCLKDYNRYVIDHAYRLLEDGKLHDNFLNSVDLNLRMINYMNN